MATKTYKATSVASTGTNWKNVSHAYDDNDSTSYAYRDYYTTSACHINGFNITDLPSDAIINTVTAYFKAATENSYGYFAGYIMCDAKTSASEYIKQSIFLNGKQASAQYYSMSVSGDELTNFATSNGLYGGSAVELLKNLRLRWVGGSTQGSAGLFNAYYCQCQVFDTYVTIDYTVPTYALDLKGKLDNGTENDNISNWGTADIYINGSIVSSGVSDYYESYTSGTTYEVKNIVANSGYKYVGNSSYSGTLTSNTTIVLPFETTSTNMTYIGTKQPTFYLGTRQVQSIYLGMTLIYKVALLKVTATFSYLNNEDTYVDKITEVYYGASVEEFAKGITDYKLPENDKNCHYINNGWVDFYGKSTLQSVTEDTTFVLMVSSEAHNIDPTIAGYDKKDPTCTEAGYIKGYCGYCAGQEDGYKGLIQVDSPATGHTDTDDDGICDVCGESIVTIVDSGTCGSNLTYTLDSNGVLTISGTGDMQNSSFGWDKDLIKSVVINDGVTNIGSSAFSGCTRLTSVAIPNSVTSIGEKAFSGCSGLTSLTIPDSVTSIGRYAFLQCTDLTSITIPNSVTSIGSSAFGYCESLTSITIPDSVTSIENNVFYGCPNLTSITVSTGNTVYHSTDNCLIETESKTLICGFKNSIIPTDGSVTRINDSAFFNCDGLTSITIPDSVTSIGRDAFYDCSNLKEVDFSTCTDIPTLESSNAFSNTSSRLVIKVPSALVDEWKAATNWSTYADKIVGFKA